LVNIQNIYTAIDNNGKKVNQVDALTRALVDLKNERKERKETQTNVFFEICFGETEKQSTRLSQDNFEGFDVDCLSPTSPIDLPTLDNFIMDIDVNDVKNIFE
jgi:hypothetical protein